MNAITASERFSVLKNGVDERLEIICDNETGFYNITKTAKMIKNLLESDRNEANEENNEVAGIPATFNKYTQSRENDINSLEKEPGRILPGSIKTARKWFVNDTTQILIDECKQQTGLPDVHYELAKDISKRFAGTYVHKLLFDHFLAWFDSRYAIKISIILDNIHQDANRKLLKEKDDKIDILIQETKMQSAEIKQQSAEIQKLLTYAQDTKQELSEARLDIQENGIEIERLNDKVDECRDVIIDRMEEHTLNPKSITKLQYFMCLQHPENDNELYAIRSQKPHIKKQLKAHHDWKILI